MPQDYEPFDDDDPEREPLDEDAPDLPDIDWDSAKLYLDQAGVALKSDKRSSFIRDNVGRCLMESLKCLNFKVQTE